MEICKIVKATYVTKIMCCSEIIGYVVDCAFVVAFIAVIHVNTCFRDNCMCMRWPCIFYRMAALTGYYCTDIVEIDKLLAGNNQ